MRIIAGSARGRKLLSPPDRSIRPVLDRIRESLFSILGEKVQDAQVLDLFAGVGSFGFEALSRGAAHVCFVDLSAASAAILRKNARNLGFASRSTVVLGDALQIPDLRAAEEDSYEILFMDPPFAMFPDPQARSRLYARLEECLQSAASTDDAVLVLRSPSECRDLPQRSPVHRRRYGESTVLFFGKGEPRTGVP